MGRRYLPLPSQKDYEYGYELAYQLAREQLAGFRDVESLCRRSGARYQEIGAKKVIIIEYLNQSYLISLPDIDISLRDSKAAVPTRERVLMLHYLISAKGTPLSNRMITYKELPEGANYFPTFAQRAVKPLVAHFGEEPQQLIAVAEKLGGSGADYGDAAATINAFPRVPITLVLWRGNEEFPPSGSIIFDSTISDYLSAEDINVLCESIVWRLVRLRGGDSAGGRH